MRVVGEDPRATKKAATQKAIDITGFAIPSAIQDRVTIKSNAMPDF
ncbi:hypothetical protein MSSD14B_42600 [Marinobacter salsuginis]|uniref:Uncharacterized protein n=1 Tax=Marinobacter salsuginis TaxID=418719 RepID=A0A5M3Q5V5_9GAMM|nr:hypothetical protein MSSD14B_42600 [Marinobacter salsuginis]